ncbi:MAG: HAD-IA family hydrolase [Fimbriimonadaceae bacterium]|nr:HAD-IA family hydrolase [Fimbriimonadaceae bacterium]
MSMSSGSWPSGSGAPEAVCLDAYDTLLTLDDPVGRLQQALAARGLPVSTALAARAFLAEARYYRQEHLAGSDAARLHDLRLRCAAVLRAALQPELPPDLSWSHEAWGELLLASLAFRLLPGVAAGLQSLRARGVRLAVVSNWDCSLATILAQLGLADAFCQVTASAVVGAAKPDPRTWDQALAALAVPPETVWHLGDEPAADAAGALAAGLRPVLLRPGSWPGVPQIGSLPELLPLLDG